MKVKNKMIKTCSVEGKYICKPGDLHWFQETSPSTYPDPYDKTLL